MRRNLSKLYLLLFVGLSIALSACGADGTRLVGPFQSYQTIADTREMLAKAGVGGTWKEETQGTTSTDRRPPYEIVYMVGPFKLSGIEGRLRLTFYNGRLMEAQFSTLKGQEFMSALRAENGRMPEKPASEIVTDVRTKFRFDTEPGGTTRFTWYDPKLENEWNKWVAEHS